MNVRRVLPPDAIESIDDPSFTRGYDGDSDDSVLVVEPDGGPARAYPILILNYHEIVNDVLESRAPESQPESQGDSGEAVDGEPVAISWCPLCGSAVVYDRIVDGRELTFGVSGKLAEDDLVMYDRETDSEWKQSTGESIAGPMEGRSLSIRTGSMMTAGRFEEEYSDGVVLDRPEGERSVVAPAEDGDGLVTEKKNIDYTVDHYAEYIEGDWLGSRSRETSRSWDRTDVAAKEVVLGIESDGEALAVPRSFVREEGTVRVTVGGRDVVILEGDEDLHAYQDPGFEFERDADDRYAGDGTTWDGATGRAEDGRTLQRVPARRLFAFAWQADHGPDSFVLPERETKT